jgi:uncharacterized membrane protein
MSDRALRVAVVALALAGSLVAGYLTYTHFADVAPVCGSGGCELVQRSSYAKAAGVPVALLGLVGYLAILGAALVRRPWAAVASAALAVFGVVFAAYLLLVQLVVIEAVCRWCVASDLILVALGALTVLRLRPLLS